MVQDITLIEPEGDSEFLRVMQYLALYESDKKTTKAAVAEYFDISRPTLDAWILGWTKSGLLAECRKKFIHPNLIEEIIHAHTEGLRAWPEIFARQLQIAATSPSDKVANEAAQWLEERFIRPALERADDPGVDETNYIEQMDLVVTKFNPMSIPKKELGSSEPHQETEQAVLPPGTETSASQ